MSVFRVAWLQRRRLVLAAGVALVLAVGDVALAAGDNTDVQYGTYVCVADRTAGIQGSVNGTDRFAGAIKPKPDHEKFFVTIRRIETYADHPSYTAWTRHDADQCFSERVTNRLQSDWKKSDDPHFLHDRGDYGVSLDSFYDFCLATSEAQIRGGDTPSSYFAIGKNVFTDVLGQRFWIYNGWRFRWDYTDWFMGNFYIAEGRCDLVK